MHLKKKDWKWFIINYYIILKNVFIIRIKIIIKWIKMHLCNKEQSFDLFYKNKITTTRWEDAEGYDASLPII